MNKVLLLRVVHGLFTLYFILCLLYLYYAAIFSTIGIFLFISVVSLAIEGFVVFVMNNGDCPFIHIQKRIGDSTPFFNIFLPNKLAKQAIPTFAKITWIGVLFLIVRQLLNYFKIQ